MSLESTSKFISLILRHKPETTGISLDEHGWADVDELINGISKSREMNREKLAFRMIVMGLELMF